MALLLILFIENLLEWEKWSIYIHTSRDHKGSIEVLQKFSIFRAAKDNVK